MKYNTAFHTFFLASAFVSAVFFAEASVPMQEKFMRPVPYASCSGNDFDLWNIFGARQSGDYFVFKGDTIRFDYISKKGLRTLTDLDYKLVAYNLGVEEAAIKAIVEIETGRTHRGFNADGSPIVNFDIDVFRTMAARRKIDISDFECSHPLVFSDDDASQKVHHLRLRQAMAIDSIAAIQGTFWGMFQIGGFNWKICGASSPRDFAYRMSRTERDQLDLFAEFIRQSGLLSYLQEKNWAAFARGYNGPSYDKQNYHGRMAAAYRKYSVK